MLSQGTGAGDGFEALSVRFRGFGNGGSDKVTFPDDSTIDGNPIPAPAAIGLFGLGLLVLGARRRAA